MERAVAREPGARGANRGIDPARIVWAPRLRPADHLARMQLADLFLDTWPCNAHTTASDALWAGVPVVTFTGRTFASRVAASLVHAVGLPELACDDIEHYARTVVELAHDPERRARLRATLVGSARTASPLFDSLRFTRDFEALLLRMMQRHVDGLPPAALAGGCTEGGSDRRAPFQVVGLAQVHAGVAQQRCRSSSRGSRSSAAPSVPGSAGRRT
jgi:hypothetical protein